MKALLADVHALETMLEEGMVESGIRRIGAEQEMFLVDELGRPVPKALEVLDHLHNGSCAAAECLTYYAVVDVERGS